MGILDAVHHLEIGGLEIARAHAAEHRVKNAVERMQLKGRQLHPMGICALGRALLHTTNIDSSSTFFDHHLSMIRSKMRLTDSGGSGPRALAMALANTSSRV